MVNLDLDIAHLELYFLLGPSLSNVQSDLLLSVLKLNQLFIVVMSGTSELRRALNFFDQEEQTLDSVLLLLQTAK